MGIEAKKRCPSVAKQDGDKWKDWLRLPAFILFLALTAPLTGTRASDETAGVFVVREFLLAAIFLLIVGTINWGVARVRKRPKKYWRAVLGFGTMITTFLLILVSFVGQRSENNERASLPKLTAAQSQHRSA